MLNAELFFYRPLVFFIGPFPEELGWRGYVLDRLQAKWNALGQA